MKARLFVMHKEALRRTFGTQRELVGLVDVRFQQLNTRADLTLPLAKMLVNDVVGVSADFLLTGNTVPVDA